MKEYQKKLKFATLELFFSLGVSLLLLNRDLKIQTGKSVMTRKKAEGFGDKKEE